MKTLLRILNKTALFTIWLCGAAACTNQVSDDVKPVVVGIAPIYTLELTVSENEDAAISTAFLDYAKSNHLEMVGRNDVPLLSGKNEGFDYQINSTVVPPPKNIAFIIITPYRRGEVSLVAYPMDTPLVKQHIYSLVQSLMAVVHGKVTSMTCDDKVLDCERLKVITKSLVSG